MKTTAKAANGFYIWVFVSMWLLKFAREQLWGSIRSLKTIFSMTLILFPMNPTMATFMTRMSAFAQADVYNGEDYYGAHFGLKST